MSGLSFSSTAAISEDDYMQRDEFYVAADQRARPTGTADVATAMLIARPRSCQWTRTVASTHEELGRQKGISALELNIWKS